ncbi:hypothetical protein MKK64_26215 [Methylobacterium sp. E-025]|jgi:hypothetical protein|uniref:hypothetical protein n=1 Tax=Methylobacterium sp. E-025 TaxID=2836561 RepID=UPI001FBA40DC|nr:hypothetical protein [Methylobacterium sp. E-025]MCJ2114665.1 hypothetical protein [Methylobacterium sp. E-025]
MSDARDDHDTHEEAWPFEEVLKAGREGAREQLRRFLDYVAENDPALAATIAAETARFDTVSHTVIEPTMREVANEVTQRGWHVSVVRDDDLDRMAVFATPGIRFYCSGTSSRTGTGAPVWPSCFVGFYGSVRNSAVGTLVELPQVAEGAVPSSEPLLQYPEVTSETVRTVLIAFLEDLGRELSVIERA